MGYIDVIKECINSFGFPIVMVGYFIWDKYKTTSPLVKAINDNTTIIARLLTKLNADDLADDEGGGEDDKE